MWGQYLLLGRINPNFTLRESRSLFYCLRATELQRFRSTATETGSWKTWILFNFFKIRWENTSPGGIHGSVILWSTAWFSSAADLHLCITLPEIASSPVPPPRGAATFVKTSKLVRQPVPHQHLSGFYRTSWINLILTTTFSLEPCLLTTHWGIVSWCLFSACKALLDMC